MKKIRITLPKFTEIFRAKNFPPQRGYVLGNGSRAHKSVFLAAHANSDPSDFPQQTRKFSIH